MNKKSLKYMVLAGMISTTAIMTTINPNIVSDMGPVLTASAQTQAPDYSSLEVNVARFKPTDEFRTDQADYAFSNTSWYNQNFLRIGGTSATTSYQNLLNKLTDSSYYKGGLMLEVIVPFDAKPGVYDMSIRNLNSKLNLGLSEAEMNHYEMVRTKTDNNANPYFAYYENPNFDPAEFLKPAAQQDKSKMQLLARIDGVSSVEALDQESIFAIYDSINETVTVNKQMPNNVYTYYYDYWNDVAETTPTSYESERTGVVPTSFTTQYSERMSYKTGEFVIPAGNKYQADSSLKFKEKKVIQESVDGKNQELRLQFFDPIKNSPAGESIHTLNAVAQPKQGLVVVGNVIKQSASSTFRTVYKANPELPFNEQKETQAGVNELSNTIDTYSVDPTTGALSDKPISSETQIVTKAVDRLVDVGNVKTVDETIDFEIIYRDNPELKAGEINVVQEGHVGVERVTTVYSVDPNSGKLSYSPVSEEKELLKEKEDRIIERGTGAIEEGEKVDQKVEPIPFETIYQDDPNLPQGEEKEVQPGIVGEKLIIIRTPIVDGEPSGDPIISETITKHKQDRIIERGTGVEDIKVEEEKIPLPFETIYKDNPELPEGEERVVHPGKEGLKVIITTTPVINGQPNGKPVVEEKVVEKPEDRVIERGTGKEGVVESKEVQPIPFETIYKDNPELLEGEEREIQPGIEGELVITTKQATFNGKPVGQPQVSEEITKQKQDRIVERGTGKPKEDVIEKIPFNTIRRPNIELAPGQEKVVQEGKEGKKVNGEVVESPMDHIIEYGPTEIPFGTERRSNPDLKPGEERVVQEGVPGLIDEDGNVLRSPIDKIIEFGPEVPVEVTTEEPDKPEPVVVEQTTQALETTQQPTVSTIETTQQVDVKPDVKTGVSDIANNPTVTTSLGMLIGGLLTSIGVKLGKSFKKDD